MLKYIAFALSAAVVLAAKTAAAQSVDADAAEKLARKSGCFKCHAMEKKKEGPPWKEIATKFKGKSDGDRELYTHLTTNPKVKIDGKDEEHDSLKSKDEKEVRNVVRWVLAL